MGGVVTPDREFGGDRGLGRTRAHQPGLAGQDAQSRTKGEVEPVDQDDVADGEPEQHCANDIIGAASKTGSTPPALSGGSHAEATPLAVWRSDPKRARRAQNIQALRSRATAPFLSNGVVVDCRSGGRNGSFA